VRRTVAATKRKPVRKLEEGITKECVAGRDKVHSSRYFSRASAKVFRFFTADGATQLFSKWALENSVEIRATIEPDSQDVFLQVQQFRTLPYVAFLFTTHVMDAGREENSSNTDTSRLACDGGKDFCLLASTFWCV
jgi:hypothetical protein